MITAPTVNPPAVAPIGTASELLPFEGDEGTKSGIVGGVNPGGVGVKPAGGGRRAAAGGRRAAGGGGEEVKDEGAEIEVEGAEVEVEGGQLVMLTGTSQACGNVYAWVMSSG